MARDRTEDGRDVKRGAVIKDNNGMLITDSKELLGIWAAYYKDLLNAGLTERRRSSKLPRTPELGRERGGSGGDKSGRSGNSNAQYEKARRPGQMKCG